MSHHPRRQPRLVGYYCAYLREENAARFIRAVSNRYDVATLERLAQGGTRSARRAAVLALGMLGDFRINGSLGRALRDDDRGVRMIAEQTIRQIWLRDGNPAQQKKMRIAVRLNQLFQFSTAIEIAGELIDEAPWLAEAHYQRGIGHACLGDFVAAIGDFQQSLELNAYHFAAAASMGQAYLELDDQTAALEFFRRALRLNPELDGVRARVSQLQRQLDET